MIFLSQYGIFIVVFLFSAALVVGSFYIFSRMGKILSSLLLGFIGVTLLVYGWLFPEDPFVGGIAYGSLALCIALSVSISWAFIDFQEAKHRQ